jgi:deoxyribonuclease-4
MINNDILIGAHESIAGGVHTAFERAHRAGCRTLQVFTKNNTQWVARPLTGEDVANYKTAASKSTVHPVVAHASYLINLASDNPATLTKSREALADELSRCDLLDIPFLVIHPGAHMGKGEVEGIQRIIESLDVVHSRTHGLRVATTLETTAGQGSSVGYTFEHLRRIMDGVEERSRVKVCLDTCHVFAAGYDIRDAQSYNRTMSEFETIIGFGNLAVIHTNDSRKGLGSRVDRHEHIGEGAIGLEGFRLLINDSRCHNIPKILETEKDEDLKDDIRNLATLRSLWNQNAHPDQSGSSNV